MNYKPTIGLEIHIELKTKTKMFCFCQNNSEEKRPNFNICPICTAQPGTLPVINQEAVRKTIKTGLALNCQILDSSKFDRKNYFYPDLPKGYQISQYDKPIAVNGELKIKIQNSKLKTIRIRRVHLEEDTGRLIHPVRADYSLVDFNRAGLPLMELVTEPDINSGKEAREFAQTLHLILHYLGVSDADMEKGEMRVEVNISLSKTKELGTKVEIKNLNSFKSVESSIEYEIKRQTEILDKGEKVIQETRGWDDVKFITVSQREKEEARDYRYFSEPDLPPLKFFKEDIDSIRAEIPELPQFRIERFQREYELSGENAEILVYEKEFGEYFEKIVSEFDSRLQKDKLLKLIKLAANYLISDLKGLIGGRFSKENMRISAENFAEFITMIQEGKISSKSAKLILEEMFQTGQDPSQIVEEKGLVQISNENEIEKSVKKVIAENQKVAKDYKKGKKEALQFLIGKIMAETKGKANPQIVSKLLTKLLKDA